MFILQFDKKTRKLVQVDSGDFFPDDDLLVRVMKADNRTNRAIAEYEADMKCLSCAEMWYLLKF